MMKLDRLIHMDELHMHRKMLQLDDDGSIEEDPSAISIMIE